MCTPHSTGMLPRGLWRIVLCACMLTHSVDDFLSKLFFPGLLLVVCLRSAHPLSKSHRPPPTAATLFPSFLFILLLACTMQKTLLSYTGGEIASSAPRGGATWILLDPFNHMQGGTLGPLLWILGSLDPWEIGSLDPNATCRECSRCCLRRCCSRWR